jgi:hypothetical protein
MTFAKMKSTQGAMKEVRIVYIMIGLDKGSVILVKTCQCVQPSIMAASSIEMGIVSKKPLAIWKESAAPPE